MLYRTISIRGEPVYVNAIASTPAQVRSQLMAAAPRLKNDPNALHPSLPVTELPGMKLKAAYALQDVKPGYALNLAIKGGRVYMRKIDMGGVPATTSRAYDRALRRAALARVQAARLLAKAEQYERSAAAYVQPAAIPIEDDIF